MTMDDLREADTPESLDKINAWLQPTDYLSDSSEFSRHLAAQAPGTGLWLRQTDEYRRWRDSDDCGTMWIKGVPGAGKSVVAASMVQLLRVPQQFPVLFFFFREIVAANHTPRALVKDWLAQLLPHSRVVQESLGLCLKEDVEENCSDDQLWSILLDGLASVETAVCVVDALDEMDSCNEKFLSRLNSLAGFRPQHVKLLLTSRPHQYLQSALKNAVIVHVSLAVIVHVSLEKDLVERDIFAFVAHRLSKPDAAGLSDELRQALKGIICAKSQGLFLYARLISDQMLRAPGNLLSVNIEALANSLPVGLEVMYNEILLKHRTLLDIDISIQKFLLQCVTQSAQPLRLNELASVLKHGFCEEHSVSDCKKLARKVCGPLLQISEDEIVQVIHHSLTEFLRDDQRQDSQSAAAFPVIGDRAEHKMLSLLCLSYLRSAISQQTLNANGEVEDHGIQADQDEEDESRKESSEGKSFDFDYQRACLEHPFLQYAVDNWIYYASRFDVEDQEFFNVLHGFFDSNRRDFQVWVWLQWGNWKSDRPGQERAHALHIAASGGFVKFTQYLLD